MTYVEVSAGVNFLALPNLLLDQGELALQQLLLLGGQLGVQLQAAHPVQALQVQPAAIPHTNPVQNERTANMNLKQKLSLIVRKFCHKKRRGYLIKNKDYEL